MTDSESQTMRSGVTDLSYAFRQLRRNPLFTTVAVLTLALGIGANTAIFSLLNGIVLRPLPYADADRLVRVWPEQAFTKSLFVQLREQSRTLGALSAIRNHAFTLTSDGEPEEVWGGVVSPEHFALLGVAPALGRGFVADEEEVGRADVVVLSHGLWQRRYGEDPDVIGRRIEVAGLEGGQRTVVGVMPRGHRPLDESWQLWVPLTIDPSDFPDFSGTAAGGVLARMAPGHTVAEADREIHELARRITADWSFIPEETRAAAGVSRLRDQLVGPVRTPLLTLLGAVALVLLIACGNVANLLLARGEGRRQEMGIRLALGAGRLRLVRQLLTESVLLSLVGGLVGLLLAAWLLPVLIAALPADVPRTAGIALDGTVLGFTLLLSVAVGVVFGLLPALRSAGTELRMPLEEGATSARARRLNRALVAGELALTVVLVVAAGLMLKSFWRLQHVDTGIRTEGVVTMRLAPPEARYGSGEAVHAYYDAVLQRLGAVPGVEAAGAISLLPLAGGNIAVRYGAADRAEEELLPEYANLRSVAGDYFRALGIRLVAGEGFNEGGDGAPEVLVNETLARRLWPDRSAVGPSVELPIGEPGVFPVRGVVSDTRQHALDQAPRPEAYLSHAAWPVGRMVLTIRHRGDAAPVPSLRDAVWSVDDEVPITLVRTMDQVVARSVADSRLLMVLLAAFGGLSLVLAAVGVYGVTAYTVSQTRFEIGVRMALGAGERDILHDVLGGSFRVALVGILVGAATALAASRLLASFLFQVRPADPVVLLGVTGFLGLVAALAGYLPAIRASRLDPVDALRRE